ncbi:MAG: arylmalonate decarboxylase [Alphaproteobacteria bacterium]|nr:arylmalonate decarboxylase [Alphaproteobacteria bacterium]
MKDALGWRRKFGVLVPATNTIVEPEFADMRPHGVTNHTARFRIPNMKLDSDAAFDELIRHVKATMEDAVDYLVPADPDYVILGISAESFWDGADASHALKARLEARAGRGVVIGAEAARAALAAVGARRIGVVTPYWPVGDRMVRRFFTEEGCEVVALKGLQCTSPVNIAEQSEAVMRAAIQEVNESNPDAIVQVGTNLAMARLADEAERWLGKPVIAINTAIYWYALRANGIADRMPGWGALMRDH